MKQQTQNDLQVCRALREGYRQADWNSDICSGIVVGIVALPLSMALAIASGVPPQHGLFTAIVAGGLIAHRVARAYQFRPHGGVRRHSRSDHGKVRIEWITNRVDHGGRDAGADGRRAPGQADSIRAAPGDNGFTSGIAVVIATLQVKDLLGLNVAHMPDHFLGRAYALAAALPTACWSDFAVGIFTLFVLVGWSRIDRRIPSPLVARPPLA